MGNRPRQGRTDRSNREMWLMAVEVGAWSKQLERWNRNDGDEDGDGW